MRTGPLSPLLLLAALIPGLALAEEPPPSVKPTLAVAGEVKPGGTLTVAVSFEIQKDWHVYWANAGDTGVPTQVELKLPEGVSWAGPWRWPTPERLVLPGELINYVYEGRLTLVRDVELSPELTVGTRLRLAGEASWLVCKEACFEGSAPLAVTVTVGQKTSPPGGLAGWIKAARARWPREPEALKQQLELERSWSRGSLTLEVPGATKLEYFPRSPDFPPPDNALGGLVVQGAKLTVVYAKRPQALTGVLKVTKGKTTHYVRVVEPGKQD